MSAAEPADMELALRCENAMLGLELGYVKRDLWQLRQHVRFLTDKTPDGGTMTIVADSPWIHEAKRLLEVSR